MTEQDVKKMKVKQNFVRRGRCLLSARFVAGQARPLNRHGA